MFAEVRLRSGTNWSNATIIPSFSNLSWTTIYNDVGSISIDLPEAYAVANGIGDNTVIEITPNGNQRKNHLFGIDSTTGSRVVDGAVWRTYSGRSLVAWLEDGIVYPSTWPTQSTTTSGATVTPLQGHAFQNATPGNILRTLVARCVERGALLWLDVSSFTGPTTTSGQAWAATWSTTYANGTSLLQVLQDMASRNLLEFRMNGFALEVFNPGTNAVHHSVDEVIFRAGLNITEETKNTDATGTASAVLIEGDNSVMQEATDSAIQSVLGRRREKYVSQGGITDKPTLLMLGQTNLQQSGHVKTEETFGVTDSIEPWAVYDVGDWVWADISGLPENYQVQQISAQVTDANTLQIGLTLGDLLDDQDAVLQRRLDNIAGGTNGSYSPLPNSISDYLAPSAPTGLTVLPNPYRDSNGIDWCQATISWQAPQTNIDGSNLTDLDHYDVQYKTSTSTNWSATNPVPAGSQATYLSSLPPGVTLAVQVRAVDSDGNASTWTALGSPVTLPKVVLTPKTPSTPLAAPAFQSATATWDGKANDATSYDASFSQVEVHLGTTNSFTPTVNSLTGTIESPNGGDLPLVGMSYDTDYYVRFVAVDKSGNASGPSTVQGPVRAQRLSDPDLPNKLITGAKIADGAITTQQLTVAALGGNVLYNPGFDDADDTSNTGAFGWTASPSTTATRTTTAGQFTVGTAGLSVSTRAYGTGSTQYGEVYNTLAIPSTFPDIWYISAKAKNSRSSVSNAYVDCVLRCSTTNTFTSFTDVIATSDPTGSNVMPAGSAWKDIEWQAQVPAGMNFVRVMFRVVAPTNQDGNASSTLTAYLDDIAFRPVGGSANIANASINNAKIASVSADKITVGSLNADVTVASRIKTADTGARVELSSTGLRAYDGTNAQTLYVSSTDGSVVMKGTLDSGNVYGSTVQAPGPAVDSAGQTIFDNGSLRQIVTATRNLVPDPLFNNGLTNVSIASSPTGTNTAIADGAPVFDVYGHTTWVPLFNKSHLMVYNTTNVGGKVYVDIGALAPSTTYTVSWYAGASTVSTDPFDLATGDSGGTVKADFGLVQVQRTATGTAIATGRTGYIRMPPINSSNFYRGLGADPGIYALPVSSVAVMGELGWQLRHYLTFTTPSTWPTTAPANAARLQLPAPVDFLTENTTTQDALVYAAIQVEAHPYATRFSDSRRFNNSVGLWFPPYSDPYIPGIQMFDQANASKVKIGSGSVHGSNWINLSNSGTQTIPSGSFTTLVWDSTTPDRRYAQDDGPIRPPANSASINCSLQGMYSYSFTVTWPANATGRRILRLVQESNNGELARNVYASVTGTQTVQTLSGITYANPGQVVHVEAFQDSGSSLVIPGASAAAPVFGNFAFLAGT